jgi:type I restriction enzyme, S subunit
MKYNQLAFSDLLETIIDNRGKTCPVSDIGIPLIATNCIKNDFLYPRYITNRYVSNKTYSSWFRGHPEPGDIIFVTKGSPGRVCLAPEPVDFCIAQDMVAIRANKNIIYPKFLFALLRSKSVQSKIENMHVGTMIPHFKKGDFDKLFLPIPDKKSQVLIGDMYYELAKKIELNSQLNRTLESIAEAIYKSWFVDFDPVNAKADGRKPFGMNDDVSMLFPSHFKEEKPCQIPQGWTDQPFSNIVDVIGGGTPKTSMPEYWDGDIPWFSVVDTPKNSDIFVSDTEKHITESGLLNSSVRLLKPGTTIITARGTVGNIALVSKPMTMNQSCYGLIGKIDFNSYYIYFTTRKLVNELKQKAHGSVFDTIIRSTFDNVNVICPPVDIINIYGKFIEPIMERIKSNVEETATLVKIRDLFLQSLLSGEIQIKQAEKLMGRVS